MKRFCVRCGVEESPETPIIDCLCPKCYIEVRGLVKKIDKIVVEYCRNCGSINVHGKWIPVKSINDVKDAVEDIIIDFLEPSKDFILEDIDASFKPYEESEAAITLFGSLGGKRISHTIYAKIVWEATLCPNCRRIVGGSYDAVVQIRYVNFDNEIENFANFIEESFARFIKEVKPVRNGYDIFLIDTGVAKRIADLAKRKWPNVKVVESYGDVKRKRDGTKKARLYISIRILNFKQGDYIVVDGKPYTVESFDGHWLILRDRDGELNKVPIDYVVKSYSRYKPSKNA